MIKFSILSLSLSISSSCVSVVDSGTREARASESDVSLSTSE